jgi:hypothetical protein
LNLAISTLLASLVNNKIMASAIYNFGDRMQGIRANLSESGETVEEIRGSGRGNLSECGGTGRGNLSTQVVIKFL